MLGTDKYAYRSRIQRVDPADKLFISLSALLLCIFLNRWEVAATAILGMTAMNLYFGGHSLSDLLGMLYLPLGFILLAVLTIVLGRYRDPSEMLLAIRLGGFYYGLTAKSLFQGFQIVVKSFGIISAVYFFVMNTSIIDISAALQKFHVPKLFTEIMELVYRFIFVLWDSVIRIHIAQSSRLGYKDYRTSYRSTADLAARVFFDAMRRADKIYTALESRGYNGVIQTRGLDYQKNESMAGAGLLVIGLQIIVFAVARRFI